MQYSDQDLAKHCYSFWLASSCGTSRSETLLQNGPLLTAILRAYFASNVKHGGPSEAGDCSHPPPKMATAKNACSCKATFDHVIWIGSLRFLACEQVLDIANPWYSNERSSRDSLASRGTRIFQREAGDSMAPDRRRRVTHGREAGDSYFRFNFCELLFRCHTQY